MENDKKNSHMETWHRHAISLQQHLGSFMLQVIEKQPQNGLNDKEINYIP